MRRFSIFDFRFSIGRPDGAEHRGFSVAEVMISLVILGLGLLFIAAALPAGIDYVRQSTDLASGEAAGQEAIAALTLNMRTAQKLTDGTAGQNLPQRWDNIFRPRNPTSTPTFQTDDVYEPFIKVRPFCLWNISLARGASTDPFGPGHETVDDGEEQITSYLLTAPPPLSGLVTTATSREVDFSLAGLTGLSLAECPSLCSLERGYPPSGAVKSLFADQFIKSVYAPADTVVIYRAYSPRQNIDTTFSTSLRASAPLAETTKALDRRLGWTAFYRRIRYNKVTPGVDNIFNGPPPIGDDGIQSNDPLAYEIIVVVSRRPSVQHRYAKQSLADANSFKDPIALNPGTGAPIESDRLFPTPWLITMTPQDPNALPTPPAFLPPPTAIPTDVRVLDPNAIVPPRLTFIASLKAGALMPPGSVLIPAANDDYPTKRTNPLGSPKDPANRLVGFVPHEPSVLPIYRVVERIDDLGRQVSTIICENNGSYPWRATGLPVTAFPFWVVPPPFTERGSSTNGQPIYERRSTIVAVVRQTIHLQETP